MENNKENMIFISGLKGLTALNKAQWNQRKPKKMVQFIYLFIYFFGKPLNFSESIEYMCVWLWMTG